MTSLSHTWPVDDGQVHAMPAEVPECGRVGCIRQAAHEHDRIETGDRVVCEPKLATAPGWAWKSPHATVADRIGDEVLVDLDDGPRRAISVYNVVKRATWMRRTQKQNVKIRTMGKEPPPLAYGEQLGLDL